MKNIIHKNEIDKYSSVLIDGLSLFSLKNDVDWFSIIPKYDKENFISIMGKYATGNLIQNMVIYDNVYFDSCLLFGKEKIEKLADNFDNILKPIYIPSHIKKGIIGKFENIGILQNDIYYQQFSKIAKNQWSKISYDNENIAYSDISDKIMDKFNTFVYEAIKNHWYGDLLNEEIKIFFNTQYNFDFEELKDICYLPIELRDSSQSFFRANFNLELAKSLFLPLSPHPVRSEYYDAILKEYDNLTNKIINKVNSKYREYVNSNGLYHCLNVPSISDIVFFNCFKNNTCIRDEVFELRDSKYTKNFRSLCKELMFLIEEQKDKKLSAKLQKITNEINHLTNTWDKDMNLNIDYKIRKINLGKIPLIGTLLACFDGWDRIEILDPIIYQEKPYIVFLNKLYSERCILPQYVVEAMESN